MEAGEIGVPLPNVQKLVDLGLCCQSESATIRILYMAVGTVLVTVKNKPSA